jgi:hypothetical protein
MTISAAKKDLCKGGGFRKPENGHHYFIMVSDLSPEICYHCGEKEAN